MFQQLVKFIWLVLGKDPAARSYRVEQFRWGHPQQNFLKGNWLELLPTVVSRYCKEFACRARDQEGKDAPKRWDSWHGLPPDRGQPYVFTTSRLFGYDQM